MGDRELSRWLRNQKTLIRGCHVVPYRVTNHHTGTAEREGALPRERLHERRTGRRKKGKYRVVQLDFTPEIEVFYMLFKRYLLYF